MSKIKDNPKKQMEAEKRRFERKHNAKRKLSKGKEERIFN